MKMRVALVWAAWGALSGSGLAGEIGFIETFALARDRAQALKQLVPGSRDYYYYSCLYYEQQGRFDDEDRMLKRWIARYGRTTRVQEIENRRALLRYAQDHRAALTYLRRRLGLLFNHQRKVEGGKPSLPTRLDPRRLDPRSLARRALLRHPRTLDGFEDRALEWAARLPLSPDQRRHLLSRLRRPDMDGLPKLIVDDLNSRGSRGFGSLRIHRLLLLSQLDECLRLKPDLRNQRRFVETYLRRLQPGPDEDWRREPAAERAYLERLWAFVSTLSPVHNSLKAHVLYHRLAFDRRRGVYDQRRFMTYLRLPRWAPYVNRDYMRRYEMRRYPADLRARFDSVTLLPPVGNDEPLVRSYLMHFFREANDYRAYAAYLDDGYLKRVFAETKIVNGLGDMEQWASLLSPSEFQALKDRVDIEFAATNKTRFGPDEPVSLDVYVKNVKTLLVKVFEIDPFNYYRSTGREVDTGVNLDGLVANEEKTYHYSEPPLRRVKRTFSFPSLRKRGVFIIEFIGAGRSSRALIRKGRLQFIERPGAAGHVFTVVDEQRRPRPDASIWMAGREYKPGRDGRIVIPYTTKPGRQAVVLKLGDFASLDFFYHRAERYRLEAGFYVDREALLAGRKARVLVRPRLYVSDAPAALKLIEHPALVIACTDREGVETVKTVEDFPLYSDRESAYEFRTPPDLARIKFTLRGEVENLTRGKKVRVQASRAFDLNGIDKTDQFTALLFSHSADGYAIDVLGKNGEPMPDRPVFLQLKHRDFRDAVNVSLQSDARGRVRLGALPGVERVQARLADGPLYTWAPDRDRYAYPPALHGKAGETLRLPYMGAARRPTRAEFSLLEKRGGAFVRDRFDALAIRGGMLEIRGLPPGDYDLLLKSEGRHIAVRVTRGAEVAGYVMGERRFLQLGDAKPLQIAGVEVRRKTVTVRLKNASPLARVHVFAVRYEPEYDPFASLAAPAGALRVTTAGRADSVYLEGRDIGDEYRYILERRDAKKYPGVLLKRPGLLLNPWALRKTQTGKQRAAPGAAPRRMRAGEASRELRTAPAPGEPARPALYYADLDFLARGSVVLANLRPDRNGVVVIPRAALGDRQQIHIVAADPMSTAYRTAALPATRLARRDLRLTANLDPRKHFALQKRISVVRKGERFEVRDAAAARFEVYDSLADVFALYRTLSRDPALDEFRFITEWPALKPERRRALYSKYACHELNFFLYHKDPAFFERVVRPYLQNKKDKTFLDHWLLGDDLSAYARPWAFERLNVVERILLGQRLKGEAPRVRRHVEDLFHLVPPDPERFNFLFQTALKGKALETAPRFALPAVKKAARPAEAEALVVGGAGGLGGDAKKAAARRFLMRKTKALHLAAAAPTPAARAEMLAADRLARRRVRPLFRPLDKTQEWAENNYYRLPIEKQNADLVKVNAFWNDYAAHPPERPFLSPNFADASHNFTEMMLALAVLDLPFRPGEHKTAARGERFVIDAASPMIAFHQEIEEAQPDAGGPPILVSQNFFRKDDRYRFEGAERVEKYVTGEFLTHVVYGCHVVVTNPTSTRQKLEALLQIPRGALPVLNGRRTRSVHIDLAPYHTKTLDYYFYFPAPGEFPHYPVHAARREKFVAAAKPVTLRVVDRPTTVDKESWDYVSQNGSDADVLAYLDAHNLGRVKLDAIAWRMRDRKFFQRVIRLLSRRHTYDHTLWSYGLLHDDLPAVREYLRHCDAFVRRCGAFIESPLLTIDPVERRTYQHLEYWPLVNARAHRLGKTRRILNDRFFAQYMRFLRVLSYRPALNDDDLMTVTCYLLLQDRVGEALAAFRRVRPDLLPTRLQYDYAQAYLDFALARPQDARQVAARYAKYPVDKWRKRFEAILAQVDEIEGRPSKVVDKRSREQQQERLAATEKSFEFKVEANRVVIRYQNLDACRVSYYLMDVELLFSRNPFVQQFSGQFDYVRPNYQQTVRLDPRKREYAFELPKRFHSANVLVEIRAAGERKAQAYYSNDLAVQLIENYGRLRVTRASTGKPLPTTYVKVYARRKDGRVRFYKDGYTDLRGQFDYASLSTNDLDDVERFALLILSEKDGAVVKEAAPPKR